MNGITFGRSGADYLLETMMVLEAPLREVFTFFSRAENLEQITPPWLHFSIRTPHPIAMQQGTIIDYRLALFGVPFSWQTEISGWDPPRGFVDRQVSGPYSKWIHEHHFLQTDGGTQIRDRVTYRIPGKWAGRVIHAVFVRRRLQRIFEFRQKQIRRIL